MTEEDFDCRGTAARIQETWNVTRPGSIIVSITFIRPDHALVCSQAAGQVATESAPASCEDVLIKGAVIEVLKP